MSPKSKNIVASLICGCAVLLAYVAYTSRAHGPDGNTSDDLQWWAATMLAFLGIAAVALIVVQIIFRIALATVIAVRERADTDQVTRVLTTTMAEDEMDRAIGLRSSRIGYICLGIGFVATLVTFALAGSAVVALNILFWAFAAGSIAAGVANIYGLERGIRNG